MIHRSMLASVRASAWALALPLVACGSYDADPPASGGAPAATGGSSVLPGGASGSAGATATGGASGSAGSGGTGGREPAPQASCENVMACGGDVTGVWFASSSCLPVSGIADLAGLGIGCPEAPAAGKLEVTGNVTFGADGKISDNTSTTGDIVIELAPPCLDVSGTVTKCDRIGAPLASAGFTDVNCVDSTKTTGGCTCTGSVEQMGGMAYVSFDAAKMGTYATAANTLTISGVKPIEYSYCVDGNFMMVTPTTKNITGPIAGTIVLQKQP